MKIKFWKKSKGSIVKTLDPGINQESGTQKYFGVLTLKSGETIINLFRQALIIKRYRRSPSPKGEVMSSRPRDMHHPPRLSPEAAALIPREPEAKEGFLEHIQICLNSQTSSSLNRECIVKSFLFQWVLSRPGSKTYKNELSKLEAELRKIDEEKEKEKDLKEKHEKNKRKSFANGIKSFCIYVPRWVNRIMEPIYFSIIHSLGQSY